jgi:drug/metabolite transporter (DMT)-like permease
MSNKTAALPVRTRLIDNAPLIVICLLLIDSFHFIFARMLVPYLPPVTSAFYVLGVATVQVAIFAKMQNQFNFTTFQRNSWLFLSIGFLVATSTAVNYSAIEFIDAGTASVLSKASIIFSLAFGLIWLRERLTRLQTTGVIVAIIGVAVITFQPGDYLRLGALMVLSSTFLYALHTALVKRYSEHIPLTEFFLYRLLGTSSFLFIFTAGSGHLVWPNAQAWLILLITATVDVVISRTLYYLSLRQLKMSLHTIILTASPVVAVLWSIFLFGDSPTLQQMAGGFAILVGIGLATIGNKRNR